MAEADISQVIQDLEHQRSGVNISSARSLLESHDTEIHISQCISLLEYHKGVAENEIFTLFV